tara:strand:- start:814 stop:1443 length:630 start_codon:yes stop_codon:yes gene_type:complete
MYVEQENVYYYLTLMNESYHQPAMPEGVEEGIRRGIYKLASRKAGAAKVQLLGSGTILTEVMAAADILQEEYEVSSDLFSVTSFNELARDGQDVSRHNMLHPEADPRTPYVARVLGEAPAVAATDYIKNYADQIRAFIPAKSYCVLGTDGFGRSDSRANLRQHFEVNKYYVVVAALNELAVQGDLDRSVVSEAIKKYNLDVAKPNPLFS